VNIFHRDPWLSLLVKSSSVSAVAAASSACSGSCGGASLGSLAWASMAVAGGRGLGAGPWCMIRIGANG